MVAHLSSAVVETADRRKQESTPQIPLGTSRKPRQHLVGTGVRLPVSLRATSGPEDRIRKATSSAWGRRSGLGEDPLQISARTLACQAELFGRTLDAAAGRESLRKLRLAGRQAAKRNQGSPRQTAWTIRIVDEDDGRGLSFAGEPRVGRRGRHTDDERPARWALHHRLATDALAGRLLKQLSQAPEFPALPPAAHWHGSSARHRL